MTSTRTTRIHGSPRYLAAFGADQEGSGTMVTSGLTARRLGLRFRERDRIVREADCIVPGVSRAANEQTSGSRARILVADDQPFILDSVRAMLQSSYDVIGAISEGDAVCAEAAKLTPDLIILDISMGHRSGIEIAEDLIRVGFAGKIVFLTIHEDADFVSAALGLGGRGYVIKSRMNFDLLMAVEAALSNQIFVSPIPG